MIDKRINKLDSHLQYCTNPKFKRPVIWILRFALRATLKNDKMKIQIHTRFAQIKRKI